MRHARLLFAKKGLRRKRLACGIDEPKPDTAHLDAVEVDVVDAVRFAESEGMTRAFEQIP